MIEITTGTTIPLSLTIPGVDLTGATFSTEIKATNGYRVIPNSQHTADPDQVDNIGKLTFTLTAADYEAIGYGVAKEVVVTVTQGTQVVPYRGHVLTIKPAHPDK